MTWLTLALAAALGFGPPGRVPPRPDALAEPPPLPALPVAETFRHALPSGAPVFLVADPTLPLVSVTIALPVGERDDREPRVGATALTAAMLRIGGTVSFTPAQFDEEVDLLGASLQITATHSRTVAALECLPDAFDRGLELLAEALLRPRFDAERLRRARQNLEQGIVRQRDDPLERARAELDRRLWGDGHPRARRLRAADLAALDLALLRDHYQERFASGQGAVFAVAGDVEAPVVLAALERTFGDWLRTARPFVRPPPIAAAPLPAGRVDLPFPTPQAKVLLGHAGILRRSWSDRDATAAVVLGELFDGSGPVSRLRRALRGEENIAYRVRGALGIGSDEPGSFEVMMETAPEHVARAIDRVVAEIERLRREEVPEAELALAQRSLVDALPLVFDTAEKTAGRFAEDVLLGRPHRYWQEWRQQVQSITAAEVQRAARRFLDPRELRIVVVAP